VNKELVSIAVCCGLFGCAMQPSPTSVGNGRYLQGLVGTEVMFEMDVVAAGHMNCPNQVGMLVQQNPKISGRCAHEPTTQPMPYSYKAHFQTNTGDEVRPSSPYVMRWHTSALCSAGRAATAAQPKAVILEDHCDSPSTFAPAVGGVPAVRPAAVPKLGVDERDEAASLQKLNALRDKGLITPAEYESKRKEILNRL